MTAIIDASLAIGLLLPDHPRHARAVALVERAESLGYSLRLAPQTAYEAWVVLSRPVSDNGYGITPAALRKTLRSLRSVYPLLPDPADLVDRWLDLCGQYDVKGKPAHDARLAAWAMAHEVRAILTLNPGDFPRYGLTVLS